MPNDVHIGGIHIGDITKLATADESVVRLDKNAQHIKHAAMQRMRLNSFLSSVSDTCKFIAGPIFGGGIVAAIGAQTMLAALPLALIAAGLGVALLSVAAGYAASRIWQSGQFDNFEINAQSTAHHLVQELKANNMCLTKDHEGNSRADGKRWQDVVTAAQQNSAQITRL